jgi:hypothetical protein
MFAPVPGMTFGAALNIECTLSGTVSSIRKLVSRAGVPTAKTEWSWMGIMFLWNLSFSVHGDRGSEVVHWSVLNPDWSLRPAFDAVREMPR